MPPHHPNAAPSDWLLRWSHLIGPKPEPGLCRTLDAEHEVAPSHTAQPGARNAATAPGPAPHVLDLACGHGRHSRWLAARGCHVTALDRDPAALASLADLCAPATSEPTPVGPVRTVQADLENAPWPLPGQQFDAVLVTNYLWRPLWPDLLASLRPGAVLIVETFAHGQARIGRPSRPEFLLQSGELLRLCQGLQVLAFEDGWLPEPARFVQRICAVRPLADASAQPARFFLNPGLARAD